MPWLTMRLQENKWIHNHIGPTHSPKSDLEELFHIPRNLQKTNVSSERANLGVFLIMMLWSIVGFRRWRINELDRFRRSSDLAASCSSQAEQITLSIRDNVYFNSPSIKKHQAVPGEGLYSRRRNKNELILAE